MCADRQSIKLQEAPTRASSQDDVCYSFGAFAVGAIKHGYAYKEELTKGKTTKKKKKNVPAVKL